MRGRSGRQNALRSGMVVLGSLAFAYLSFKVGFNPYLEQARKAMEGSEPTAGVPFETEQFMKKPHTSPISFPQEKTKGLRRLELRNINEYLLLGAVPFPKDVLLLQQLGVRGVVTLNEPYETLVPSSLYKAHGIDHLVIPTRDYLFAPSVVDISRAVDFIHRNASCGGITYVHCKAGRGRSTTIVLCYLIEYKNMTPADALEHVRSKRPRVLLAPSQWQAVQEYGRRKSEFPALQRCTLKCSPSSDAILITEADIQGYNTSEDCSEGQAISLHCPTKVRPALLSQLGSTIGDEVLITYEDLEGYDGIVNEVSKDRSNEIVCARAMVSRLSCFFSTFRISSSCSPPSNRLQEVQAC